MKKRQKNRHRYLNIKNLLRDPECLPSLQIPKKMIWTASALKCFRKCERKFFWKYIARISPLYPSPPLVIGSAFHAALADWYQYPRATMLKIAKVFQDKAEKQSLLGQSFYDQEDYDKLQSTLSTLIGMLLGYSEIYGHEREQWHIPRKNIEARFSVDCGDFDFQGSVDCIPRIGKSWTVVEHKTAAKLHDSYLHRLPQDTQVRGYIFGAKHGLNIPVKNVCYDVVKKCKLRKKSNETAKQFNDRIMADYMSRPDFYFMRENLLINNRDLAMFENDLFLTHNKYKQIIDNSPTDALKPTEWGANDGACYEYFRNCEFMPLCLSGVGLDNISMYQSRDTLHQELGK